MAEIIKIGVLGIMGVLMAVQFKGNKPEYAILTGICISILIFGYSVSQMSILLEKFELLKNYLGGSGGYLSVLVKVIGITYVCEFSAGICKDAGYGAIAEQIEILGKLSVVFAGLPVIFAVIEQISAMT